MYGTSISYSCRVLGQEELNTRFVYWRLVTSRLYTCTCSSHSRFRPKLPLLRSRRPSSPPPGTRQEAPTDAAASFPRFRLPFAISNQLINCSVLFSSRSDHRLLYFLCCPTFTDSQSVLCFVRKSWEIAVVLQRKAFKSCVTQLITLSTI